MKTLLRTLFILAFLVLAAQTVRHVYHRFLLPTTSVLDKFEQPLHDEIANASSLDELVTLYEKARTRVEEYEKTHEAEKKRSYEMTDKEPYRSQERLKHAITDWETKQQCVEQLRYYWGISFCMLLLGMVVFAWIPWLGAALVITGFCEMIFWTSPGFFGADTWASTRLLNYATALSSISLVSLIVSAAVLKILRDEP